MPIYAYRCSACGHAQDVLQKLSDPLLSQCPACGAETFTKQVTAAGFQLKGSGWYVTDFRGGNSAPAKADADGKGAAAEGEAKPDAKAEPKAADSKPADSKPAETAKPAAPAAAGSASPKPAASPPAPSAGG